PGYQVIQSTIAVGSGGVQGKGYQQGTQSHNGFLEPYQQKPPDDLPWTPYQDPRGAGVPGHPEHHRGRVGWRAGQGVPAGHAVPQRLP
ncbi:hypothetical protein CTI14_65590, partial [Methylobacterium radiotolerans]